MADGFTAERFGLTSFSVATSQGQPELDTAAGEELAGSFPSISLAAGDHDLGQGTLFISTRRVMWASTSDHSQGYAIGFPSITMHALSSDTAAFQRPCIYMQLDASTSSEAEEDDDDAGWTPELRLIPADISSLERMFQLLCDCAAKNPDPGQEEDEGEFYYDEEEVLAGAGADDRAARLGHYDALLTMPSPDDLDELVQDDPGRFEDDEEELPEAENGAAPAPSSH